MTCLLPVVLLAVLVQEPAAEQPAAEQSAEQQQQAKPRRTPIDVVLNNIDDYVVRLTASGKGGTGFMVHISEFYVITAYHVVERCAKEQENCVFATSPWYSSFNGRRLWVSEVMSEEIARVEAGDITHDEFNELATEREAQFDEKIDLVLVAYSEPRDIAILRVTSVVDGHPIALAISRLNKKYDLADEVYLYGKPYEVNGKYPGVLRSGIVAGYLDYGPQSRLLIDIRTTDGESGAPVIHVDSGRIIGIGVGSIVKERRAEMNSTVDVDQFVRSYDLSDEVSGVCSVVPYFYIFELGAEAGLWGGGKP